MTVHVTPVTCNQHKHISAQHFATPCIGLATWTVMHVMSCSCRLHWLHDLIRQVPALGDTVLPHAKSCLGGQHAIPHIQWLVLQVCNASFTVAHGHAVVPFVLPNCLATQYTPTVGRQSCHPCINPVTHIQQLVLQVTSVLLSNFCRVYTRNEGSSLFSFILPTPLGLATITVMHRHSHCLVVSLSGSQATKHSQLLVRYDYSCHSCIKPVTHI